MQLVHQTETHTVYYSATYRSYTVYLRDGALVGTTESREAAFGVADGTVVAQVRVL